MRLAIDVMSGDLGPRASVPASMQALEHFPFLSLDLYGDVELIQAYTNPLFSDRYKIVGAASAVTMGDSVTDALRQGNTTSMGKCLSDLADGSADGVVSAGNTAALLALACRFVGCIESITRPAICAQLPREDGCFFLLDCGANISADARQLHSFARMGSALAKSVTGLNHPRVALLNVGSESQKGSSVVREAAQLIGNDEGLNFSGFVEGDGFFSTDVDVIVCDGFVGNVALKATEGLALHVGQRYKRSMSRGWRRFFRPLSKLLFARAVNWLNPHRYNGASLLGLSKVVVKSHGGANADAFFAAIESAIHEVEAKLPKTISNIVTNESQ